MKRFIFFISILLSYSPLSLAQGPSKEELQKTAEHIDKLIKRDSINTLIIEELKKKTEEVQNVDHGDSSKTLAVNPSMPDNKAMVNIEKKIEDNTSLFAFVLLAFGAGLLSLLTPCVFPMIPLTVTFFTSTSSNRGQAIKKAWLYGTSIVAIFTAIGLFAGPVLANVLSTHWIPNTMFFLIFMIFGFSFLGLFEITLPSSFVNKVDAQSEKGGLYGVFFMAFTLVLVSFSCTVPIVGLVLVESSGGIALKPLLGMLAYSTAFAIPFTLFALFPEWLKKLPKSGGWMNVIKVVLGFVEIALAFKFLSMVDQVYHLNILDREIYIAIWIVVFALMGIYLLGKLRLPHDSEVTVISVPRLVIAMIPLVFVVYLIPGLFGAPLKALSGYLPPMSTHDFDLPGIIRESSMGSADHSNLCSEPKYSKSLKLPHGLKGYFTYEEGLQCAKEKNLPLFVDFTGHACVSCREVEANVWSDPEVLKMLKNEFVLVSLYVDDRTLLPKEEWYESPKDQKTKKTLGAKNSDLQISKFGNNAQPYYWIIDPQTGQALTEAPVGYEPSVINYLKFLTEGVERYKKLHSSK